MQNVHYGLILLMMLMSPVTSANAQVSIGIGLPNVSIGISLPVFPELVPVPGFPVYYAPRMDANYFFYDGMYWVYQDDNWYASSWYNGPWRPVQREFVPLFILRIPVRYYRQPPAYFRGWQSNAPPRWGQHWGRGWEQQRSGWDKWNRSSAPPRAPLPVYQRQYSGDRYPRVEQQQSLRSQSYRYQSRDKAVQQHFKQIEQKRAPVPEQRQQLKQLQQSDQRQQHQKQQDDQMRQREQQLKKQQTDQKQQNDQRQQHQKQQDDQMRQREQQQKKQQNEQKQQREQQQQKQQIEQRQHEQQQQNDLRQQQQKQHDQSQQNEQRQKREQQQAPRVQEREQRQQDRGGALQEPNRNHEQGQNRDDDRGRGRDK
jgi:hypothetical protein